MRRADQDRGPLWARVRSHLAATVMVAVHCAALVVTDGAAASSPLVSYEMVGDSIPRPLAPVAGDASRGRRIVIDREVGNCLICHHLPEQSELFQGDLGPDLAGVGSRLTAPQLRLRIVDQTRLNAASIMPAYYRIEDLARVAERYAGKPVLTAEQIEDVVAYLASLKD